MKRVLGLLFISIGLFSSCSKETASPNAVVNTNNSSGSGSSGSGSSGSGSGGSTTNPGAEPFSANFVYTVPDPNNIFEKQDIQFKSTGTGIVSWVWRFGNGTKQLVQNPVMNYMIHGYYEVSLTVTDADGKTATSKQEISILCNFLGH